MSKKDDLDSLLLELESTLGTKGTTNVQPIRQPYTSSTPTPGAGAFQQTGRPASGLGSAPSGANKYGGQGYQNTIGQSTGAAAKKPTSDLDTLLLELESTVGGADLKGNRAGGSTR